MTARSSYAELFAWLSADHPNAGAYAVLCIVNHERLMSAYAQEGADTAIRMALASRLAMQGIDDANALLLGELVLVRLSAAQWAACADDKWYVESLASALSFSVVKCGSYSILMDIQAVWQGTADRLDADPLQGFTQLHVVARAVAYTKLQHTSDELIRRDMALVCDFFQRSHSTHMALFFQRLPLVEAGSSPLYYEGTLRHSPCGHTEDLLTVEVQTALERLHLTARVDSVLLSSVIQALQHYPHTYLSCNLSALSLRFWGWWKPLLAQLRQFPALASHLRLNITEPVCDVDMEASLTMLRKLRELGCCIAFDGIGDSSSQIQLLAAQLRQGFMGHNLAPTSYSTEEEAQWGDAHYAYCQHNTTAPIVSGLHQSQRTHGNRISNLFLDRVSIPLSSLRISTFLDDFINPQPDAMPRCKAADY